MIGITTTGAVTEMTKASPVNPGKYQIFYELNIAPPETWSNIMATYSGPYDIKSDGSVYLKICALQAECLEAILRPVIEAAITFTNEKYDAWKEVIDAHEAELATHLAAESTGVADVIAHFND